MVQRVSWLSITPEPERELPAVVAALVRGGPAPAQAVEIERARVERLLLHGSQRQWLSYLNEVSSLIDLQSTNEDPVVVRARARAASVLANHHNLLLGLPGQAAERTAGERARLTALAEQEPAT